MVESRADSRKILDAAAATHTEAAFLDAVLTRGRELLGSFGASAFLFDAATDTFRMARSTYSASDRYGATLVATSSPLVERTFAADQYKCFGQDELASFSCRDLPWGSQPRAFALGFPVRADGRNAAFFVFDYEPHAGDEPPLDLENVAKDLRSSEFANAIQRVHTSQAWVDLNRAVQACSGIHGEITRFLANYQRAFEEARLPVPDLVYLQLVDWRRGVVRTVRGRGLPLSFQNLAHSLDSKDIQAELVKQRSIYVILGNDTTLLDQGVHYRYRHEDYVRLFFPLFPFPFSLLNADESIEAAMLERIAWDVQSSGPNATEAERFIRETGTWDEALRPPQRLVYGTLELGYRRAAARTLEPFTHEFVTWCMAQAYALTPTLYEATLDGALAKIGRTVTSIAQAGETRLWADLSPGGTYGWTYPVEAAWPAAIAHEIPRPASTPPDAIAGVKFEGTLVEDPTHLTRLEHLRELASESTRELIRVALQIDEHLVAPYVLRMDVDDHPFAGQRKKGSRSVGIAWPDEVLREMAKQAARDSGAQAAALWLFEGKEQLRIGWPTTPADDPSRRLAALDEQLVRTVATQKMADYPSGKSLALMPLELGRGVTAVLALGDFRSPHEFSQEEKQTLEGKIERWVQHLDLRRMANFSRFTDLLQQLRQTVARTREMVSSQVRRSGASHVESFGQEFLTRATRVLQAAGAMLTVHRPESMAHQPDIEIIERFWIWTTEEGAHRYDRSLSRGRRLETCAGALEKKDVLCYHAPPLATGVLRDPLTVLSRLAVSTTPPTEGACTVLVIPALARTRAAHEIAATVTLFIHGVHSYETAHRRLILELGELIASTLSEMREQDELRFTEHHRRHLEVRRRAFVHATCLGDLIGALFRQMGKAPEGEHADDHWNLADNAVLWLLSPSGEKGTAELVLRSWRGWTKDGKQTLPFKGREVFQHLDHPFLESTDVGLEWPSNQRLPRCSAVTMRSFVLAPDSKNALVREYARCVKDEHLISFPLVDTNHTLYGIVDLSRSQAFEPGEDLVVSEVLERLAVQFCQEFENCLLRRGNDISQKLQERADRALALFRVHEVYQSIVEIVREHLHCQHCDLFLARGNTLMLEATTRRAFTDPTQRSRYIVGQNDWLFGGLEPKVRRPTMGVPTSPGALSPALAELLGKDHIFDRVAIPLRAAGTPGRKLGTLSLVGPIEPQPRASASGRAALRTSLVNEEHLRLAMDHVGVAVARVLVAVLPVEQQGWLVTQANHSLRQPLTTLSMEISEVLRAALQFGVPKEQVWEWAQAVRRQFRKIEFAGGNLTFLGMETQAGSPSGDDPFVLTHLTPLIKEVVETFSKASDAVSVLFNHPRIQPAYIMQRSFRLALDNLLDNAVKYSFAGQQVRVDLLEIQGRLTIRVTNRGVGIPLADKGRIFEPFFRSLVNDRFERRGTGLGLAQVKHVIEELHRGTLRVESEPADGRLVGSTAKDIEGILHETRFIIELDRRTLQENVR